MKPEFNDVKVKEKTTTILYTNMLTQSPPTHICTVENENDDFTVSHE